MIRKVVLFLDFDGVLHPFHRPSGVLVRVPDFERVLRDFPAVDIVISSAWREHHTLEELKSYFSADIAARIIGATPVFDYLEHQYVREAEIANWLYAAARNDEPWVALDDIPAFFSPQCPQLILVDPETGFNTETERELRMRLAQPAHRK